MREYILFDATSYCFGPAGSLNSIVDELHSLLSEYYDFVFAGYGSSMELMRLNDNFSKLVNLDTEDFEALESMSDLVCNASAIVTNTNPVMAIYAKSKGKRVFVVDILPWMHNTVVNKIESVRHLKNNSQYFLRHSDSGNLLAEADIYIYQKYLVDFELDKLYKKPFCIAPISQIKQNENIQVKRNKLVISTGGLFNPDVDAENVLLKFGNQIIEAAVTEGRKHCINSIVLCGPQILQNKLEYSKYDGYVSVVCLKHSDFLQIIAESEFLAIVPGLTTIYEAFLTGNPTLLLPSTNFSQILQTEAVRKAGLGERLVCEDIFTSITAECIKAGEVDGTEKMMKHMSQCIDSGEVRRVLEKGFDQLFVSKADSEFNTKRKRRIEEMGNNGAKEAANIIYQMISEG